jgi:hypothetical protein
MMEQWNNGFWENGKVGLGSDIGHGLFVGWVEHLNLFCWVSPADQPTCQPFLCYQRNPTKWPKIGSFPLFQYSIIPIVSEAN